MLSSKEVVNTEDAPAAIGPYSQAIKANGFVFVSGCIGIEAKSGEFASDKVEGQTEQALQNMKAILKAAGSSMDNVVQVQVLLRNMHDYGAVNKIYAKFFESGRPARAAYAVTGLPKDALVEITATAICEQ